MNNVSPNANAACVLGLSNSWSPTRIITIWVVIVVVESKGLIVRFANLTINPLDSTTTITTQIVMILVGDQEFDSPKTQAAFALGLTLFIATLFLNYIALRVVKKYREKYD